MDNPPIITQKQNILKSMVLCYDGMLQKSPNWVRVLRSANLVLSKPTRWSFLPKGLDNPPIITQKQNILKFIVLCSDGMLQKSSDWVKVLRSVNLVLSNHPVDHFFLKAWTTLLSSHKNKIYWNSWCIALMADCAKWPEMVKFFIFLP